jgi:hypothetical protein
LIDITEKKQQLKLLILLSSPLSLATEYIVNGLRKCNDQLNSVKMVAFLSLAVFINDEENKQEETRRNILRK